MRKYYVRYLNNCEDYELVYTRNNDEDKQIAAWTTNCDDERRIIYGNDEISFSRITRKEALKLARRHGHYIFPWSDYREVGTTRGLDYDFDGKDELESGYIICPAKHH